MGRKERYEERLPKQFLWVADNDWKHKYLRQTTFFVLCYFLISPQAEKDTFWAWAGVNVSSPTLSPTKLQHKMYFKWTVAI